MRTFTLLLIALFIALMGQNLIANAEQVNDTILRDGLLISIVGAFLFAISMPSHLSLLGPIQQVGWKPFGRTLAITGIVCALVGGLLFTIVGTSEMTGISQDLSNGLGSLPVILWLLGIGLFLIGTMGTSYVEPHGLPSRRWQRDPSGAFVRTSVDDNDDPKPNGWSAYEQLNHGVGQVGRLFVIVLLGGWVRIWGLYTLTPNCINTECAWVMGIVENASRDSTWQHLFGQPNPIYQLIVDALFLFIEPSVFSLRLAGILIGTVTLPLFYFFVSSYTRTSSGLLATTLLVLSPWHIWASLSAGSWLLIPLLLCLSCGAIFSAYRSNTPRWWAIAGISVGLLIVEFEPLRVGLFFWIMVVGVVGFLHMRPARSGMRYLIFIAGVLGLSFPWLLHDYQLDRIFLIPDFSTLPTAGLEPFATALFGNDISDLSGLFAQSALLGILERALFVIGLVAVCRNLGQTAELLLTSSFVLFFIYPAGLKAEDISMTSLLLVSLPFIYALIAVPLEQLLYTFQRSWGMILHPSQSVAGVLTVLIISGGITVFALITQLDSVSAGNQSRLSSAIGDYLAEALADDTRSSSTIFIPPSAFSSPSVRMLAGTSFDAAVDAGQIRAFDAAQHLLLMDETPQSVIYLLPIEAQPFLELIQQIYPDGQFEPHVDEEEGQLLFFSFQISGQSMLESQGLQGHYYAGNDWGNGSESNYQEQTQNLHFNWSEQTPIEMPFSAEWQGTLLVPTAGTYAFQVETNDSDNLFSLRLDNVLILDSSLGLNTTSQELVQGAYQVEMRFRHKALQSSENSNVSESTSLTVLWQPPEGGWEPIPASMLRTFSVPNLGLAGTYYAGEQQEGKPLTQRKDFLVGLDADFPRPYSVRWQGKIAASRAGEYTIATQTVGISQLLVDGQLLFNTILTAEEDGTDESAEEVLHSGEGRIYLDMGWHDITVDYIAPQDATHGGIQTLQLLWQAPGSTLRPLESHYLTPVQAALQNRDLALPSPPPLIDPSLGSDAFALSPAPESLNAQSVIPPTNLPTFNPTLLWQIANGCGSAENQLRQPRGVAIDEVAGRIYVADTANRRILVYNLPDGSLLRNIESDLFQEPFDIDIRRSGLVPPGSDRDEELEPLVLDAVAQQIFQLDPLASDPGASVSPLPQDTGFYRPRGMAVDPVGNILVADTGGGRLVILSPEGQMLAEFGGQGTIFGLGQPVDVAVANGQMWAVTAEDGRIWQLTGTVEQSGTLSAVKRANTFDGPHFADLPDGSFLLTDPARQTILYFASDGQPLAQFGMPEFFVAPVGIDVVIVDTLALLAITDSATCTLSLWELTTSDAG